MLVVHQIDESTAVLVGVSWDVAEKGMGRAEARARAKSAEANAVLLRASERNIATCQLEGKLQTWRDKRLVPLGSALADAASADSWCGVFEFEERYVFFAANNRCILPDADAVYKTAAEARVRLDTECELFDAVYAPTTWAYPRGVAPSELLDAVNWQTAAPMTLIEAGASISRTAILLGGAGVLLFAFVGFQYWRNVQIERENAERARQAPPVPVDPWLDKAKPINAYQACQAARAELAEMAHYGWALEKLECDISTRKFDAALTSFTTGARLPPHRPETKLAFKSDGSGLALSGALTPEKQGDRGDESGSLETALSARTLVVSYGQSPSWQVSGNRHQFSFQISTNLQEVAWRMSALPTLSLNRIEYSGDQWRVDGEIFN
jgi:hypothetical protein